jgi:putative protein kinase ArgK-like GTPase of G3E family
VGAQRDLSAEFRAGNVRGLARAITLVEQTDGLVVVMGSDFAKRWYGLA